MNTEWNFDGVAHFLFWYVFYYPFFMAYLWMAGGIAYHLYFEARGSGRRREPPVLTGSAPRRRGPWHPRRSRPPPPSESPDPSPSPPRGAVPRPPPRGGSR